MATPKSQRLSTSILRAAVEAAVARMSFRGVAAETGVSPMGLHRLLSGAEPQLRTRVKLEAWYLRNAARLGSQVDSETAEAALRLLARGLPLEAQAPAILAVVATWEREYDAAGTDRPAWLVALRSSAR